MLRLVALAALFPLALVGCGGDTKTTPSKFENEKDKKDKPGDDHGDHDRGTLKLEDTDLPGGKKGHAALTAHLSKAGNHELDLSFETFDAKPVPIPIAKVTASVIRRVGGKAEDKAYTLEFAPAPKDERKGDPDGQCSRFVADAKWMKPDDELTVTLTVPIDGKDKTVVWTGFLPKKWGHEGD